MISTKEYLSVKYLYPKLLPNTVIKPMSSINFFTKFEESVNLYIK